MSNHTFSGGEDLAYTLQALKRATIIGATTGSGAHPVTAQRLGDHFADLLKAEKHEGRRRVIAEKLAELE